MALATVGGFLKREEECQSLTETVVNEHEYIFSGRLEVDYLNEKYHIDLQENEEYETLEWTYPIISSIFSL
mgnify:CR=1 FL=1